MPVAKRWYQNPWVKHSLIWFPILISACLLVAGIILVVFFRGRVCTASRTSVAMFSRHCRIDHLPLHGTSTPLRS